MYVLKAFLWVDRKLMWIHTPRGASTVLITITLIMVLSSPDPLHTLAGIVGLCICSHDLGKHYQRKRMEKKSKPGE